MINQLTIDEALSPFSKWLARTLFNEQHGRTLSQKIEDEQGISKSKLHLAIGGIAVLGALSYFNSRRN